MNNRKLSIRLSACLDALSSLSRIADIGTDHAYLPCYGIANGLIDFAIAIDVIDGPLAQAKRTIEDYGLADKIELRQGSGFEPLSSGEVEGVVIAGMGGKLISNLLLDHLAIAKSMKRLVFQPQDGIYLLRNTLHLEDFEIVDEQMIEENDIIYTIIVVEPRRSRRAWCKKDIIFGPVLRQNVHDELFIKYWEGELAKVDELLRKIPDGNERKAYFEEIKRLIKEVLPCVIN